MRLESIIVAALLGEAVLAHGDNPIPRIVGGRAGAQRGYEAVGPRGTETKRQAPAHVGKRQDNRCGADYNDQSCDDGECCSASGYCGTGSDYCKAPECQISYGPGCDGNQIPDGEDTSDVARTQVGSVPYGGVGIYNCANNGEIAITFDDGPYLYTDAMLDKFLEYGHVATFFITGNNIDKGMINNESTAWPDVIRRMASEGHQIASHTWSHENFSTLTTEQLQNQMIYNEIALDDILGYFPTYMRPPYSICPETCQEVMSDLGYHITYFDLDTEGYLNTEDDLIEDSKVIWDDATTKSADSNSYLNIEHDIHQVVAEDLVEHMLSTLTARGYKSVTVGQCLNDPCANWYRAGTGSVPACSDDGSTATSSSSASAPTSTAGTGQTVSTDGTCTSDTITCVGSTFGDCCSQHGWCGTTDGHCGTGCDPTRGTCTDDTDDNDDDDDDDDASTEEQTVSTDATCTSDDITCVGSAFGDCCSQYGWCGATDGYCGTGCNTARGTCS